LDKLVLQLSEKFTKKKEKKESKITVTEKNFFVSSGVWYFSKK